MKEVVILVDHGSSVSTANQIMEELAGRLKKELHCEVVATHMEIADPIFKETLFSLLSQNSIQKVLVVPLFFVPGKHFLEDIEKPLKEAKSLYPSLEIILSPPLLQMKGFFEFLKETIVSSLKGRSAG
jgi:sirohydrochlorin ferrochelatase